MAATGSVLALLLAFTVAPGAAAAPAPVDTVSTDSAGIVHRVVRRFPPIEVRAPIHDLLSSQSVRMISAAAFRTLPAERLADVVRQQAGVVAEGGEMHVRGGRAGELEQVLDGVRLNDPLRGTPMDVPLLALRAAELVSGGQDAEHSGSLAGVLDLHTLDPGESWGREARWATNGGSGARFDQASARVSGPVRPLGLGVAAAADVTLDDTWLPALRSNGRRTWLGTLTTGWRAENRVLGWLKLVPRAGPQVGSLQILSSRQVHEPYDPAWSQDGWAYPWDLTPAFSTSPLPGYGRYRAADHLDITDERRLAAVLQAARVNGAGRSVATLGWMHGSSVTSLGGRRDDAYVYAKNPALFGFDELGTTEPYYVYWGDDPFYRESESNTFTLRADHVQTGKGERLNTRFGAGLTYEEVSLREVDGTTFGQGLDSLRAYHAFAPGGFAYAQARWRFEGLVLNGGLRAQYFTAGPQASKQALEEGRRGWLSFSPRLGVAYPLSTRDVLSLSYVRLSQDPPRDYLYDNRRVVENRRPQGNPALEPATVISYQVALTRLFSPAWAMQTSVFYRDVFGQVGARSIEIRPNVFRRRYTNDDEAHTVGCEWSLLHEAGEGRRVELHYTWMQAYGNESRPDGELYVETRGDRPDEVGDYPLSWDQRHTIATNGAWALPWRGTSISWATAVGSPLPWTPKQRREVFEDLSVTNSRRLGWTENTDLGLRWTLPRSPFAVGLDVTNLFDSRFERAVTIDGYPHPLINTYYDDYGAYRTETGRGGGAYWEDRDGDGLPGWIPVNDPRLYNAPRRVRANLSVRW
jgi:outer membrane receptor protein involved in Fe transport